MPILWKDKPENKINIGLELARDNKFDEFKDLISKGWNVLTNDKNGSNALHWASGQGNMEIVK